MTTYIAKLLESVDHTRLDTEHLARQDVPPGIYAVSTAELHKGCVQANKLYPVTDEEVGRTCTSFVMRCENGVELVCLWGSGCAHQRYAAAEDADALGRWIRVEVTSNGNVAVDHTED